MPSCLRLAVHDPTEAGAVLRCIMNQRCETGLASWLGRGIASKEGVVCSASLVRVGETAGQGLWQGGRRRPRPPGGVPRCLFSWMVFGDLACCMLLKVPALPGGPGWPHRASCASDVFEKV